MIACSKEERGTLKVCPGPELTVVRTKVVTESAWCKAVRPTRIAAMFALET